MSILLMSSGGELDMMAGMGVSKGVWQQQGLDGREHDRGWWECPFCWGTAGWGVVS